MNQSFQNIFEKYNIISEVPRTRFKPSKTKQTHSSFKKQLEVERCSLGQKTEAGKILSRSFPNTRKSLNLKPSCYFNTNTKGKYYIPTRYKTLDIIGVNGVHKNGNCSITENGNLNICTDECSSKENRGEQNFASSGYKAHNKSEIQPDCLTEFKSTNLSETKNTVSNGCIGDSTKNCLSNSLNITKCKEKPKNYTGFEKQDKLKCKVLSDSKNFSSFPETSYNKDAYTTVAKPVENTSTELDLLIDLIEREERSNVEGHKQKEKFYCDNDLSRNKSYLKGGYEELFERALKQEKVKSNFLKYDKKIGFRTGQLLTVVNIKSTYGLTLAMVKSEDLNKNFAIAVAQEMAQRLKLDAKIEAFFDDKTFPYKMQLNGEWIDVYLEPYKLLIV